MFSSAMFFSGLKSVCPKGILRRRRFQDGEHMIATQQLDCQQSAELHGGERALTQTEAGKSRASVDLKRWADLQLFVCCAQGSSVLKPSQAGVFITLLHYVYRAKLPGLFMETRSVIPALERGQEDCQVWGQSELTRETSGLTPGYSLRVCL